MARVLVIGRDAALSALLRDGGHVVEAAGSAAVAVAIARAWLPEIIMIDAGPSDRGVARLCRELRAERATKGVVLMVLDPNVEEETRVAAFEAGVDDCVAKPYSARELVLRVRALIRRPSAPEHAAVLTVGAVRIDRAAMRVEVAGGRVELAPRELEVLVHLAERAGKVQTREAIVRAVWGEIADSDRVVDTTIRRVRRKLGDGGVSIQTVRGHGYKLVSVDVALPASTRMHR